MNSVSRFRVQFRNAFAPKRRQVTIEVLRILVGAWSACWALGILIRAKTWFGDYPLISVFTAERYLRLRSPYAFSTSGISFGIPEFLWLYLVIGLLFTSVLMAIGWRTRLNCLLSWVLMHFIQSRLAPVMFGGDTVLQSFLLFLLISSPGQWLAIRSEGRTVWSSIRFPCRYRSWGLRLIQLQVSVIYIATALWKFQGQSWRNGTATYQATQLLNYGNIHFRGLFSNASISHLTSWLTLGLELAIGTLIWIPRLRFPLILLGMMMHLGIDACMRIPYWQTAMMIGLLSFTNDRFWVRALIELNRKFGRSLTTHGSKHSFL